MKKKERMNEKKKKERIKRLEEAQEMLVKAQEMLNDIDLVLPDDYSLLINMYSPATEDAEKCLTHLENRVADELDFWDSIQSYNPFNYSKQYYLVQKRRLLEREPLLKLSRKSTKEMKKNE
jgi:hypothetical protein